MKKIKYLILIVCLIALPSCSLFDKKPVENNTTVVEEPNEWDEVPEEDIILGIQNNNIKTLVNYSLNSSGDKVNNSSKMSEVHNSGDLSGLKMEIISKKDNPRNATFTLTIKNNSNEDYSKKDIVIDFIDKDGNSQNLVYYQVDSFKPGETIKIVKEEYLKIIDAYDYKLDLTELQGVG